MLDKKQIDEVIQILLETFPDAKAELDFSNPFELLIATILSAQCTDVRVNKITGELFKEYNTPEDFLKLSQVELGKMIYSCGFYKNKSKSIDTLMKLPGVGRKTANVVASNAFGVPAIAVDTHVFRVSNRIGIADSKNVLDTEKDLMENIPRDMWTKAHHLLIFHGRRICKSRKPLCDECPLIDYCLYYRKEVD
jgi:endonuclease III